MTAEADHSARCCNRERRNLEDSGKTGGQLKNPGGFTEQLLAVQRTGQDIMKIQTADINRCAVYTKLDGLTDHPEHGRCCHTDRAFFTQFDAQQSAGHRTR